MKRLSAIGFLTVLLFNFYGYRLVIDCMQYQQAAILETKLDKQQYKDDELIAIKTAINLPYYTSSKNYERAYGSIEVNGVMYEYVKRRVYQDTLELLCLPNTIKTHLQSVKNEFFKLSVDGIASQQNKKAGTLKITLPDFCQEINLFTLDALSKIGTHYFSSNTVLIKADYSSIGEQPPESIS